MVGGGAGVGGSYPATSRPLTHNLSVLGGAQLLPSRILQPAAASVCQGWLQPRSTSTLPTASVRRAQPRPAHHQPHTYSQTCEHCWMMSGMGNTILCRQFQRSIPIKPSSIPIYRCKEKGLIHPPTIEVSVTDMVRHRLHVWL